MSEIYWITRLDPILDWATAFTVLSAMALIVAMITKVMSITENRESYKTEKETLQRLSKYIRNIGLPLFLFFAPITIFLPNKKDAMMIYGIGGSIDYLRSNETAQQLPDKCIDAINEWVESLIDNEHK